MDHHITVCFHEQDYEFHVRDGEDPDMTWDEAQAWIDREYVNTRYEALEPVGLAPVAEKLLHIAIACGALPFANRTPWAEAFVRCTGVALGRRNVRVDVANGCVRSESGAAPDVSRSGQ